MATGKRRDARKEQAWRRWVAAWRTSGQTVRAFCARHGLAEQSFYGWRRELARREAPAATFLPVLILAEPSGGAGGVELVLAGDRTVRVAPGFDVDTLRRLLAVLEGQPC